MAHPFSVKCQGVYLRLETWHTFPVATYERLLSDDAFLRRRLKREWAGVGGESGGVPEASEMGEKGATRAKWAVPSRGG